MAIIRADDELAAVKARLRALKAMTTDRGCTEAEAMAATVAAARLMQQHGLSPEAAERPPFAEAVVAAPATAVKQPWASLWRIIANGCSCEVWHTQGVGLIYFGFEPDVLVADYLHAIMVRHVDTARRGFLASAEYRRRRTRRTKTKAATEFLYGFVGRLCHRLREFFDVSPREDQAERRQAVTAEVARKGLTFQGSRRTRAKVATSESYFQGAAAAGRVDIHGGVSADRASPGVTATQLLGGPRS